MRTEKHAWEGGVVQLPVAESYADCLTLVKSDLFRINGSVRSSLSIVLHALRHPGSSVLFWFRLCQHDGMFHSFCRSMYLRTSRRASIHIPLSTRVGYGLYLGHTMCIVINGGTIIGNNVNISHFVSIGTNHDSPAVIGDNVYVGPNVSIVEDVRIGNEATIGAGAVVTKDIPAGATVAGVPARVLNYNAPGRYIQRRWTGQSV